MFCARQALPRSSLVPATWGLQPNMLRLPARCRSSRSRSKTIAARKKAAKGPRVVAAAKREEEYSYEYSYYDDQDDDFDVTYNPPKEDESSDDAPEMNFSLRQPKLKYRTPASDEIFGELLRLSEFYINRMRQRKGPIPQLSDNTDYVKHPNHPFFSLFQGGRYTGDPFATQNKGIHAEVERAVRPEPLYPWTDETKYGAQVAPAAHPGGEPSDIFTDTAFWGDVFQSDIRTGTPPLSVDAVRRSAVYGMPEELNDLMPFDEMPPLPSQKPKCPLCNIPAVLVPANVELLSRFLTQTGLIMHRKVTGLCHKDQRRLAKVVKRSRSLGHLPGAGRHRDHPAGLTDQNHEFVPAHVPGTKGAGGEDTRRRELAIEHQKYLGDYLH